MNLIYTPLIGLPLALLLAAVGFLLCLTIVGIPAGAVCLMLASRVLTLRR